ncbi:MAG: ABC transporter substrate-binding protein [Oscillospiraceae bacterium]|jgi:peptide/nickel transport system substrate-binding protein|nr:ABC transporter substrate-binding protein [Oscillospiraceae bacterium]
MGLRLAQKKRVFALLAAAVLLSAALGACGSGQGTPETTSSPATTTAPQQKPPQTNTIALPFANRDVLNPYKLQTELNMELHTLLYEGLFTTDDTFKAQPVLAKSIAQTDALRWQITLQAGRVFHNGNPVAAADVLYSFEKARGTTYYAARLQNIASLREKDGKLELILHKANQYIAANLDFPIVPVSSAEQGKLRQAKNGYLFTKDSTPVGTGRYALKTKDGAFVLQHNKQHPGKAPKLTTLTLFGVNNSDARLYGLELGKFSFAYDSLKDGQLVPLSFTPVKVPTRNLVFLGLHSSKGALQNANFRAALAACIDPSVVLSDAYHGYAEASGTPFPPQWFGVTGADFAKPFNAAAATEALVALGFDNLTNGVRASRYQTLRFTLLTDSGNPAKLSAAKTIKAQLARFNIKITINAQNHSDYLKSINAGNFDLYIGEICLTPDCSLLPLLSSGGSASRGVQTWGKAASTYGQLLQGLVSPAKFVSAFQEDVPFVPLGYRCGVAAAARGLRVPSGVRQNDLYCGIAQWEIKF